MNEYIPVGLLCTILGVLVAYVTHSRGKAKDDKSEGRQDGVMLTELGYIKSSIDSVSKKMDKQDERHLEVVERISKVEASAKQAHLRIDRMEGRDFPHVEHEHQTEI